MAWMGVYKEFHHPSLPFLAQLRRSKLERSFRELQQMTLHLKTFSQNDSGLSLGGIKHQKSKRQIREII